MNKVFSVLKMELIPYFSLNEYRRRKKSSRFFLIFGLLIGALYISGYNVLTAVSLVRMGQMDAILAYMLAVASVAVFLFTFFQFNDFVFNRRDFEKLSVLPLTSREIVLAKQAFLYLLMLGLSLIFVLPAGLVWLHSSGQVVIFLVYLILLFFLPMIPIFMAAMAGLVIARISVKVRYKNAFTLILSLLLLGLFVWLNVFSAQEINLINFSFYLSQALSKIYPLALLFLDLKHFFLASLVFILLSLAASLLGTRLLGRFYGKMDEWLGQEVRTSRHHKRQLHSPFVALYQKELGSFLHSSTYMLNAGLGVFFLIFLAFGLLFVNPAQVAGRFGLEKIGGFLPLLVSASFALACPAASSLSLEGENHSLLQTMPLSMRQIVGAKLSITLSLHFFAYLLVVPIFLWRFPLTGLESLTLLLLPLVYSFFTAAQGMYLNLLFPRFDWDSEVVIIKQSKAALLSGLLGLLSVIFPVLLAGLTGLSLPLSLWLTAIVLFLAVGFIYHRLSAIRFLEK